MNKDICIRCSEGVVNIRVGAIIIKENKVLMVKNIRDDYYYSVGGRIQSEKQSPDQKFRVLIGFLLWRTARKLLDKP